MESLDSFHIYIYIHTHIRLSVTNGFSDATCANFNSHSGQVVTLWHCLAAELTKRRQVNLEIRKVLINPHKRPAHAIQSMYEEEYQGLVMS